MSDRKERSGEEKCRAEAGAQKEAALRHRIPQSRLEVAAIKKLFRQRHDEKLIEHPEIKVGGKPRPEVRRRAVWPKTAGDRPWQVRQDLREEHVSGEKKRHE